MGGTEQILFLFHYFLPLPSSTLPCPAWTWLDGFGTRLSPDDGGDGDDGDEDDNDGDEDGDDSDDNDDYDENLVVWKTKALSNFISVYRGDILLIDKPAQLKMTMVRVMMIVIMMVIMTSSWSWSW